MCAITDMTETQKLLVTTALVDSWGSNEEIIFLGEWCKPYDPGVPLESRLYSIVPFHWSDDEKLRSDYDYLADLFERVLNGLALRLNDHHGVDRSSRYWRIVLGPWLLHYLSIAWDRWENLRIACEINSHYTTIVFDLRKLRLVPRDHTEFQRLIFHDLWNHELIRSMIDWEYSEQIRVRIQPFDDRYPSEEYASGIVSQGSSLRDKIVQVVDSIADKIQKKYSVVCVSGSFDTLSLIRLAVRLKQLPRKHCEFFEEIRVPRPSDVRSAIVIDIAGENSFEKFLETHIIDQIPITYLEGYKALLKKVDDIRSEPRTIFTTNEHLTNDLFNVWSAGHVDQGKKLVVSQHGGAIKSEMTVFLHQEKISDKMVVWHQPLEDNHVQLSPIKLISAGIKRKSKKDLTLVAFEAALYPYRAQSGPKGPHIMEDYVQKLDFINELAPEVTPHLSIRARSNGRGWFQSKNRFADDIGIHKCSPSSRTLQEAFARSRLIVCTYPQTTFSEAMHSGIPTILLYDERLWQLDAAFGELVSELKKKQVVFSDPILAAGHVNEIWEDPDAWWTLEDTTRVREMFFDLCARVRSNWLSEWVGFFRSINEPGTVRVDLG